MGNLELGVEFKGCILLGLGAFPELLVGVREWWSLLLLPSDLAISRALVTRSRPLLGNDGGRSGGGGSLKILLSCITWVVR